MKGPKIVIAEKARKIMFYIEYTKPRIQSVLSKQAGQVIPNNATKQDILDVLCPFLFDQLSLVSNCFTFQPEIGLPTEPNSIVKVEPEPDSEMDEQPERKHAPQKEVTKEQPKERVARIKGALLLKIGHTFWSVFENKDAIMYKLCGGIKNIKPQHEEFDVLACCSLPEDTPEFEVWTKKPTPTKKKEPKEPKDPKEKKGKSKTEKIVEEKKEKDGQIYVIGSRVELNKENKPEKYIVKIGYTTLVLVKQIKILQNLNDHTLDVLYSWKDVKGAEQVLFNTFDLNRLEGDWFSLSIQDLENIVQMSKSMSKTDLIVNKPITMESARSKKNKATDCDSVVETRKLCKEVGKVGCFAILTRKEESNSIVYIGSSKNIITRVQTFQNANDQRLVLLRIWPKLHISSLAALTDTFKNIDNKKGWYTLSSSQLASLNAFILAAPPLASTEDDDFILCDDLAEEE